MGYSQEVDKNKISSNLWGVWTNLSYVEDQRMRAFIVQLNHIIHENIKPDPSAKLVDYK